MTRWTMAIGAGLLAVLVLGAAPAHAYEFSRPLQKGDSGKDVKRLQVRLAGWYPHPREHFILDGDFGAATKEALEEFQESYDLKVDGIANAADYDVFDDLESGDGSTKHFDYNEFEQNYNSSCSAKANAYADTLAGGMVSEDRAGRNVRRLMWRLEAVRRKSGRNPIGINSGFRSLSYNDCIGGARSSQHMYGTAADNRVAEISNRKARKIAKRSELHGIGCYNDKTHNHFDIRMDNGDLDSSKAFWYPDRDAAGRDLDDNGRPCWGETSHKSSASVAALTDATRQAILGGVPNAGSVVPSAAEIAAFEQAGEVSDLQGDD